MLKVAALVHSDKMNILLSENEKVFTHTAWRRCAQVRKVITLLADSDCKLLTQVSKMRSCTCFFNNSIQPARSQTKIRLLYTDALHAKILS